MNSTSVGQDRPLRVVKMIDGLGRGGAERVLTAIATELSQSGHDVQVLTLQERDGNPEARALEDAGIPVKLLRLDKLRNVRQIAKILKALRQAQPDVIHAHLEASSFVAGLASWYLSTPAVSTLHTLERPETFNRASLRLWMLNQFYTRSYDKVVCLSHAMEMAAREGGLAKAPLAVLPNGVDLTVYDPRACKRDQVRAELGYGSDDLLIATVAVLRKPKGVDRLVKSMSSIVRQVPRARLLIVGDGEERQNLELQVQEANLREFVKFVGFRNDVPDLLSASDLFVLPTLWDALPTVIIEAMASGLPTVASNVGGVPDLVRHDHEGLLVPPGDTVALGNAVAELLKNKARRQTMSDAAVRRAEDNFSLPKQVRKLVGLYRSVVKVRAGET